MKTKLHFSWKMIHSEGRSEILEAKCELLARYLGLYFDVDLEGGFVNLNSEGITPEQIYDIVEKED